MEIRFISVSDIRHTVPGKRAGLPINHHSHADLVFCSSARELKSRLVKLFCVCCPKISVLVVPSVLCGDLLFCGDVLCCDMNYSTNQEK